MPVLYFLDLVQQVEAGLIRGLYHSKLITVGGFIGYFIVALPMSVICAFHLNMGVYGLWLGLIFGSMFLCLYYKWLLQLHIDWDETTRVAVERGAGDGNNIG